MMLGVYGEFLDYAPLAVFLESRKIERWRREQIIQSVRNALGRYVSAWDGELQRQQLRNFLKAARKLQETLPFGGPLWSAFYQSIATTWTRGVFIPEDHSRRALDNFPRDLEILCRDATAALEKLTNKHRSTEPKTVLVRELAEIWTSNTGLKAGFASSASWDQPITIFGEFVKVSVSILPDTSDFERGFAGLLRRATKVSEPAK